MADSSRLAGTLTILAAGLILIACLVAPAFGVVAIDVPWAPSLDLRFDLALDGIGVLYAGLASGIGLVVFVYASAYMPLHLRHQDRPGTDARRFWAWMALFMVAMVGLACARDLVLIFVFFDLTAVASYFLIGFDRERREARGAAFMALTVTGISAVLLLAGAVVLYAEYGTFSVPELTAVAQAGPTTTLAMAMIAVAALAKSAQVPLHFWLPRAMAAPTPVSAYLHSAAMVAAGGLVLGRVHPLLALNPPVLDALLVIGLASIFIGGTLALAQDELKQILAYSTISQYGYVVVLYGIGGAAAAGAAALYVVAHAVAKSALFLTAGAVTEATGELHLSRLGGLARSMPVLAVSSGIAAASLAALPLTMGFFKDELFFAAAAEAGPIVQVLAVAAAALTVAYIGRFWLGLFAGPEKIPATRSPALLLAPIVVLAAIALAGGVFVEPFAQLAAQAAAVTHGAPVPVAPAYHLDARPVNLMAVAAWALGALVIFLPRARVRVSAAVALAGDAIGPRRWYGWALMALRATSERLHDAEVRDMRTSLAAVLVPSGVLLALGFLATPTEGSYVFGLLRADDLPVIVLLALVAAAALAVARDRGRLRAVLGLSVLGFALAAVYAAMGAPDVALVAVLIETVLTIVFVAALSRMPVDVEGTFGGDRLRRRHARQVLAGVIGGAGAFATIWAALSRTSTGVADSTEQLRLAPAAHGGDVVTVILADFRGFDTMVEITVLTVAVIGAAGLLRRGKLW